jgi:hypothetical protein
MVVHPLLPSLTPGVPAALVEPSDYCNAENIAEKVEFMF